MNIKPGNSKIFINKQKKEENKMSEILKLTINGNPEYIKIAKMAVGQAACMKGLDIEKTEDLQMAVGEACRLISCHGHPCWSDNYCLVFEADDEKITVTIEDEKGSHTLEKVADYQCLECPHEGDMGVKLMECVMDEVEISRADVGCKSIKLTKKL